MTRRAPVAFVGPSLPAPEARRLLGGTVLPPARQGDIWRALRLRPSVLVLIDGVFEAQPSAWHREIISALGSGVAVFGGSSMGALRAAELSGHGMVGVGRIYQWLVDGTVVDDSEVALLHADAEHGFRPLTVPLVNVRYVAEQARARRILTRAEAARLLSVAGSMFYQGRTWAALLRRVAPELRPRSLQRWRAWERRGLPDLKADDARACLRAARSFAGSGFRAAPLRTPTPSAWVRHRRIMDGESGPEGRPVRSADCVRLLMEGPEADELVQAGMRRSVLAALGRAHGLTASEAELLRAERAWRERLGRAVDWPRFLAESGMDAGEARRLCEEQVLEAKVLHLARGLIPDAPSDAEALAQEARLRGLWGAAVRKAGRRP